MDRLKQLCTEAGQLIEDPGVARVGHGARPDEQMLISLKTILRDAAKLAAMLHSEHAPINRMPTEVLTRIFSFVRTSVTTAGSHAGYLVPWSYTLQDTRSLLPLLLVCRRWRDIALNAPLLWSHIVVGSGVDSTIFARSARVPLVVSISDTLYPALTRSTVGLVEYLALQEDPEAHCSAFKPFCKTLKSVGEVGGRIRGLHINVLKYARIPPRLRREMVAFLTNLDAGQLEECTIEHPFDHRLDSDDTIGPRLALFSRPGLPHPSKLRSLQLASVPFLPSNNFPALTQFSLSHANVIGKTWGADDFARFLSGSPKLQSLYIRNIQFELRAALRSSSARATLDHLRHLWFDFPSTRKITAVERLASAIALPSDCHVFLATLCTMRHDVIDQLFKILPYGQDYTRLLIRAFKNEGTTVHFIPSSRHGSLSIGLLNISPAHRNDPWRDLRALFDESYPWCSAIEELWLEFAEEDYFNGIRCVLGRFPALRSLVVSQPWYVSPGGWYTSIDDAFRLLRPARDGSVACPALDTLCINVPAYSKNVDALKHVLLSRGHNHPIRRLVVGYSPVLELDVLAEVFSLEDFVKEFICEEVPQVGRATARPSDWLLNIPKVFKDGILYRGWPKWVTVPRSPPPGTEFYYHLP